MTNKIEEIILGVRVKCPDCMWNKEETNCQNCKDCLSGVKQAIYQAIEGVMPKEREQHWIHTGQGSYDENADYNQALSDTKQTLSKLFGREND
jgi:hypothetical protein